MKTTEFLELHPSTYWGGKDYALQHATMAEVWDNCPRADWLLWICEKHAPITQEQKTKLTSGFAKMVLHYIPDDEDRPRLAIEAAERWLEEPTEENRAAAYAAADAAAYFATYAGGANATRAAVSAAYAAYAAYSVYAAAYSIYTTCTTYAAAYTAARAAERREQADIVRSVIPNPFSTAG